MKKRLISLLSATALLLTLFVSPAMAIGEEFLAPLNPDDDPGATVTYGLNMTPTASIDFSKVDGPVFCANYDPTKIDVIKGTPAYPEYNKGAHYYAHSNMSYSYTGAHAKVTLPTSSNVVTNNRRNAFISLGIAGLNNGVDLGIRYNGTVWCPYMYDVHGNNHFVEYSKECKVPDATYAVIDVAIVSTTVVQLSVVFQNASGGTIASFWKQIPVASGNFFTESGKINCRFYRFASLVQIDDTKPDDRTDGTKMGPGKFTNCQLYNGSSYVNWGISSSLMGTVWKVWPSQISLSYSGTTDTFTIKHS